MTLKIRVAQTLVAAFSIVAMLMISLVYWSPAANATDGPTCVAAVNNQSPTRIYYMDENVAQWGKAIVVGGQPDSYDEDIIDYDFTLDVDAAMVAQMDTASEVCLELTTSSRVWRMNNGSAVYSVDIDVTHILTDGTEINLVQFTDSGDASDGNVDNLTIEHAESLTRFGVVLQDGETFRFTVNGLSVADSVTANNIDQASLWWYIWQADIGRPRLVLY